MVQGLQFSPPLPVQFLSSTIWANAWLELTTPPPPLHETFRKAVESVALDTDQETANIPG
jgi:hypothetical protein